MGGEIGAHRIFAFFANVVSLAAVVEVWHLVHQVFGFLRGKQAGEKQITFTVEFSDLLRGQSHESSKIHSNNGIRHYLVNYDG